MPIWLRNFTLRKISAHYEKEHAATTGKSKNEKSWVDPSVKNQAKNSNPESNQVQIPDFLQNKKSQETTKFPPNSNKRTSYK
jgi:hypothetical protein